MIFETDRLILRPWAESDWQCRPDSTNAVTHKGRRK